MAKCEITGRRRQTGNNVSHAHNKSKRTFKANIQKVKIVDENGTVRRAYVSTRALKSNAVAKAAPRKILREIAEQDAAAKA